MVDNVPYTLITNESALTDWGYAVMQYDDLKTYDYACVNVELSAPVHKHYDVCTNLPRCRGAR